MSFLLGALVFLPVDLARPIPVGYVDILLWAIFLLCCGRFFYYDTNSGFLFCAGVVGVGAVGATPLG